jgi:hypothetical protein
MSFEQGGVFFVRSTFARGTGMFKGTTEIQRVWCEIGVGGCIDSCKINRRSAHRQIIAHCGGCDVGSIPKNRVYK